MRSREAVRLQDLLPAFHTAGHHEATSEADRSSRGALLQRKVSPRSQLQLSGILEREAKYAGVIDTTP